MRACLPLATSSSARCAPRRRPLARASADSQPDVDRVVLACTSKECKRNGALKTLALLQSACEQRSDVRFGTTRCQSECASGPNLKLLPEGAVLNEVRTIEEVEAAIARCVEYESER